MSFLSIPAAALGIIGLAAAVTLPVATIAHVAETFAI